MRLWEVAVKEKSHHLYEETGKMLSSWLVSTLAQICAIFPISDNKIKQCSYTELD